MRSLWLLGVLASVAVVGAGCGSECGDGTVEENGVCVPEGLGKCGAGTALQGGECKPACGAGLTAGVNGCIIAQGTCGAGTELVEGQCRVLDYMRGVTQAEAAEPNDTAASAQRFTLPAVGGPAAVLGGRVDVARATGADFDWFVFQGLPMQRVKLEAIAVGAPSIAVELVPAAGPASLTRYVIALDARQTTRELVLPVGGDWLVKVSETNNFSGLLSKAPRGAESFTYVVKVSSLAPPTPHALTGAESTGSYLAGDVYSIAGGAQVGFTQLALASNGTPAFQGTRVVWAVDADGNLAFAAADGFDTSTGAVTPMDLPRFPVPQGGLTVGIDAVITIGGTPGYGVRAAPVEVTQVTDALPQELEGSLEGDGIAIFAFDALSGQIVSANIEHSGSDVSDRIELRNTRFELLASNTGYSSVYGFVKPGDEGRWYVIVRDGSFSPQDTSLDFTVAIHSFEVESLGTLQVPGTATHTISVDGSNPTFASVTVAAGARVALLATPEATMTLDAVTALDARLAVLADDGNYIEGDPIEFSSMILESGATMILAIEGDMAGMVEVMFETEAFEPPPEQEPNNTLATATPIDLSAGFLEIAALLPTSEDYDYYRFELTAPSNLALRTVEGILGGTPDTVIELFDGEGTSIGRDDDSGADPYFSLLTKTGLSAGTYYVKVSRFSMRAYIDYTLQIEVTGT